MPEAATIEPKWYVVLCVANHEADAYVRLKGQGYTLFWPRAWHTWSRNNQTTSELRSVLSRYLFVAIDNPHQSVMQINETPSVLRVLTFGEDVYVVPSEIMGMLRRRYGNDGIPPPDEVTAAHLHGMLKGTTIEVAAMLMAAFGRIRSVNVERPHQRHVRSRRAGRGLRRRLVDDMVQGAYVVA